MTRSRTLLQVHGFIRSIPFNTGKKRLGYGLAHVLGRGLVLGLALLLTLAACGDDGDGGGGGGDGGSGGGPTPIATTPVTPTASLTGTLTAKTTMLGVAFNSAGIGMALFVADYDPASTFEKDIKLVYALYDTTKGGWQPEQELTTIPGTTDTATYDGGVQSNGTDFMLYWSGPGEWLSSTYPHKLLAAQYTVSSGTISTPALVSDPANETGYNPISHVKAATNGTGYMLAWYRRDSAGSAYFIKASEYTSGAWGAPADLHGFVISDVGHAPPTGLFAEEDSLQLGSNGSGYALAAGFKAFNVDTLVTDQPAYAKVYTGGTWGPGVLLNPTHAASSLTNMHIDEIASNGTGYGITLISQKTTVLESIDLAVFDSTGAWQLSNIYGSTLVDLSNQASIATNGTTYMVAFVLGQGMNIVKFATHDGTNTAWVLLGDTIASPPNNVEMGSDGANFFVAVPNSQGALVYWYDGIIFSATGQPLTGSSVGNTAFRMKAILDGTNVGLVYSAPIGAGIFRYDSAGTAWVGQSGMQENATNTMLQYVDGASDNQGNMHVFWKETLSTDPLANDTYTNQMAFTGTAPAKTATPYDPILNDPTVRSLVNSNPRFHANATGNQLVTWTQGGKTFGSFHDGTTWGTPVVLPANLAVTTVGADYLIMGTQYNSGPGTYDVVYQRWNLTGGTWSGTAPSTLGTGLTVNVTVGIKTSGDYRVVYWYRTSAAKYDVISLNTLDNTFTAVVNPVSGNTGVNNNSYTSGFISSVKSIEESGGKIWVFFSERAFVSPTWYYGLSVKEYNPATLVAVGAASELHVSLVDFGYSAILTAETATGMDIVWNEYNSSGSTSWQVVYGTRYINGTGWNTVETNLGSTYHGSVYPYIIGNGTRSLVIFQSGTNNYKYVESASTKAFGWGTANSTSSVNKMQAHAYGAGFLLSWESKTTVPYSSQYIIHDGTSWGTVVTLDTYTPYSQPIGTDILFYNSKDIARYDGTSVGAAVDIDGNHGCAIKRIIPNGTDYAATLYCDRYPDPSYSNVRINTGGVLSELYTGLLGDVNPSTSAAEGSGYIFTFPKDVPASTFANTIKLVTLP